MNNIQKKISIILLLLGVSIGSNTYAAFFNPKLPWVTYRIQDIDIYDTFGLFGCKRDANYTDCQWNVLIDMGAYQDNSDSSNRTAELNLLTGGASATIFASNFGGVAAPSGTIDPSTGEVVADFNSFILNFNGTDYNIGAAVTSVATNIDLINNTADVNLSWSTLLQGGALDGNVFNFAIEGSVDFANVNSVPIPAVAWLFGSGLIGLIGFSRRINNS